MLLYVTLSTQCLWNILKLLETGSILVFKFKAHDSSWTNPRYSHTKFDGDLNRNIIKTIHRLWSDLSCDKIGYSDTFGWQIYRRKQKWISRKTGNISILRFGSIEKSMESFEALDVLHEYSKCIGRIYLCIWKQFWKYYFMKKLNIYISIIIALSF